MQTVKPMGRVLINKLGRRLRSSRSTRILPKLKHGMPTNTGGDGLRGMVGGRKSVSKQCRFAAHLQPVGETK
jgi:hypothetical protein